MGSKWFVAFNSSKIQTVSHTRLKYFFTKHYRILYNDFNTKQFVVSKSSYSNDQLYILFQKDKILTIFRTIPKMQRENQVHFHKYAQF